MRVAAAGCGRGAVYGGIRAVWRWNSWERARRGLVLLFWRLACCVVKVKNRPRGKWGISVRSRVLICVDVGMRWIQPRRRRGAPHQLRTERPVARQRCPSQRNLLVARHNSRVVHAPPDAPTAPNLAATPALAASPRAVASARRSRPPTSGPSARGTSSRRRGSSLALYLPEPRPRKWPITTAGRSAAACRSSRTTRAGSSAGFSSSASARTSRQRLPGADVCHRLPRGDSLPGRRACCRTRSTGSPLCFILPTTPSPSASRPAPAYVAAFELLRGVGDDDQGRESG